MLVECSGIDKVEHRSNFFFWTVFNDSRDRHFGARLVDRQVRSPARVRLVGGNIKKKRTHKQTIMRRAERLPLALNMQDVAEFYLMTQLICTRLLFSKTGPVKKNGF